MPVKIVTVGEKILGANEATEELILIYALGEGESVK